MKSPITGLHHITAISGPAQENVDFYNGFLGLRFVKKTVNFDDPGTYHLYYADNDARPGSFLTFFPWGNAVPGRNGKGLVTATAYAVPSGSIDSWMERFAEYANSFGNPSERFGEQVLSFYAPDGLVLELIESKTASGGWKNGPVPLDMAAGVFHSVTICSHRPDATQELLTQVMGYEVAEEEVDRKRLVNNADDYANVIDLACPDNTEVGRQGTGTIHHIAFRVPDEESQRELRDVLISVGLQPTPVIDRMYFKSVYFREPGGILFEIATDNPGFAIDEPADRLGHELRIPPQHEHLRERIEQRLPSLTIPYPDQ